jgi:hypothetical protein
MRNCAFVARKLFKGPRLNYLRQVSARENGMEA